MSAPEEWGCEVGRARRRVLWSLSSREDNGRRVGICGIRSESALEGWGHKVGRARGKGVIGSPEPESTVGGGWAFVDFGL